MICLFVCEYVAILAQVAQIVANIPSFNQKKSVMTPPMGKEQELVRVAYMAKADQEDVSETVSDALVIPKAGYPRATVPLVVIDESGHQKVLMVRKRELKEAKKGGMSVSLAALTEGTPRSTSTRPSSSPS